MNTNALISCLLFYIIRVMTVEKISFSQRYNYKIIMQTIIKDELFDIYCY